MIWIKKTFKVSARFIICNLDICIYATIYIYIYNTISAHKKEVTNPSHCLRIRHEESDEKKLAMRRNARQVRQVSDSARQMHGEITRHVLITGPYHY